MQAYLQIYNQIENRSKLKKNKEAFSMMNRVKANSKKSNYVKKAEIKNSLFTTYALSKQKCFFIIGM